MLETTEMNFIYGQLDGDKFQAKEILRLIKPHFKDFNYKVKERVDDYINLTFTGFLKDSMLDLFVGRTHSQEKSNDAKLNLSKLIKYRFPLARIEMIGTYPAIETSEHLNYDSKNQLFSENRFEERFITDATDFEDSFNEEILGLNEEDKRLIEENYDIKITTFENFVKDFRFVYMIYITDSPNIGISGNLRDYEMIFDKDFNSKSFEKFREQTDKDYSEEKDMENLNELNFITGYADGSDDDISELITKLYIAIPKDFTFKTLDRADDYRKIFFLGFSKHTLDEIFLGSDNLGERSEPIFDLYEYNNSNPTARIEMVGNFPEVGIAEHIVVASNNVSYTKSTFKEWLTDDALTYDEYFKEEILDRDEDEKRMIEDKYNCKLTTREEFEKALGDAGGIMYITDADYLLINLNFNYRYDIKWALDLNRDSYYKYKEEIFSQLLVNEIYKSDIVYEDNEDYDYTFDIDSFNKDLLAHHHYKDREYFVFTIIKTVVYCYQSLDLSWSDFVGIIHHLTDGYYNEDDLNGYKNLV